MKSFCFTTKGKKEKKKKEKPQTNKTLKKGR